LCHIKRARILAIKSHSTVGLWVHDFQGTKSIEE
jgi:hypothetical protein